MLRDAPLLTVRRNFARPSPQAVAALAGTPTSFLVDALGGRGGLDYRIKSIDPSGPKTPCAGVAVTCHCGPADNLALAAALDVAGPGDVLVAATDEFTGTSVSGDLLVAMAKNRGVVALVTDGLVRDVVGILRVGIAVFCRGASPNSPARNGPGTVGQPITIGGVTIDSGDLVVGDGDGVVVVPRTAIEQVKESLAGVREAEASMEAKVQAGLDLPEYVRSLLESDRVREVA